MINTVEAMAGSEGDRFIASRAATRAPFGKLADGTAIERVTLTNANGMTAVVITLGATLQALHVPDRDGRLADVVLGYDDAASYRDTPRYFGATVGRCANRIAAARFVLDGEAYDLEANDGPNHLHGGSAGLDQQIWTVAAVDLGEDARVTLACDSPEGTGGYPGALSITAAYALDDDDRLTITYAATTTRPTIVNITNHSFFNLAGEGDVMDHHLTLHAAQYTPVDEALIPTGEIAPVANTPFDFRQPIPIGARIAAPDRQLEIGRGYDHNFAIDGTPGKLRPAARLHHPASGRAMELSVAAPGVQFYSGNFLDGSVVGKRGRCYRRGDGLCLEPQAFPDAPNQPHFPSIRLDPGETYGNRMMFAFSTDPATGMIR